MSARQLYDKTPLVKHQQKGTTYWLKMDSDQPTGSFKIRGMANWLWKAKMEGYRRVVSSSGGNAGYSAAWIADKLNMKADVIVPETTSKRAIELIESTGAKVHVQGADWYEADIRAREVCNSYTDALYTHPFDHPALWEGHASIIDECKNEMGVTPDAVVVAVGGGGLFCGISQGMNEAEWFDAKIITCETEGTASMDAAIKKGGPVDIGLIDSVATSLGARCVTSGIIPWLEKFDVSSHVISDDRAIQACVEFKDKFDRIVEPACGTVIDFVHHNAQQFEHVLVVICGGIGTTTNDIEQWRSE